MTDEDVLRRILHEEALTVNPEGSFSDVERRLRRTPRWLAPVAAAAALAVVIGAVALVAAQDDETDVTTTPATDVTTTVPPTTAVEPVPGEVGQGVWPFRTGAEADDWAAANPGGVFFDPEATARQFLDEYVGMTEIDVDGFAQGDSRSGEVVARTRVGGPETVVLLRLLGESDVWTVIGAFTDTIRLDQPEVLAEVRSPVQIRGESCCAFEGNVVVQVREDGQVGPGEFLGQEPLIGGSMAEYAPLEGEVALDTAPTQAGGAVVAFTSSAEDGSIERATVVRVRFGADESTSPALGDDQLVAVLSDERVPAEGEHTLAVLDGDGTVARELTSWVIAEGGIGDVAVLPDQRTVLYTVAISACESQLRTIAVDGSAGGTLDQALFTTPWQIAVHPAGDRIAFSTDDDCDGQSELVVSGIDGSGLQRWPDAAADETGADALLAVIRSIAWVDEDTLALGMQYEDGTTTRLHELANPDLPVGSGPDVVEGDDASYDLPTTIEADGWVGLVRRCCGTEPSSNSILRRFLNPEVAESPPIEVPEEVAVLGWRSDVWFWVTVDHQLVRSTGSAITAVADGVADFAL